MGGIKHAHNMHFVNNENCSQKSTIRLAQLTRPHYIDLIK